MLLREAQIAVSPGVAFGEHGDGHIRISLVENRHRIRQAARNLKTFLGSYDKVLEESEKQRAAAS
jgi:alanine-synthesizing transaminase